MVLAIDFRLANHKILGVPTGMSDETKIKENSKVVETFKDSLNEDQKLVLDLLNIEENEYWRSPSQSK